MAIALQASLAYLIITTNICLLTTESLRILPPIPFIQRHNFSHSSSSTNHKSKTPLFATETEHDSAAAVSSSSSSPFLELWPSQKDNNERNNNDAPSEESNNEQQSDSNSRFSSVYDSIIKIYCTHSEPDCLMPWQRQHQSTSTSSGFVIEIPKNNAQDYDDDDEDNEETEECRMRIMTNAHAVEYGSIIQVRRRGDDVKYEAIVEAIGNECDLALLRVDDDDFWTSDQPMDALSFGPLPALQNEVEVLGYPTGGDSMSVTKGVVSRIEMQEYAQAGMDLLCMQIDAAINPGNSGGPVMDENLNVVGVAFQSLDSAENIGYVVPVIVVKHFLEDIRRNSESKYTGFCQLGVGLSLLENAAFRASLGMKKGQSGVMVRNVQPTTAAKALLKPSDVIMEVDGIPVANDGKIPFRRGERVALGCYISSTLFDGDSVRIKLLREGQPMELNVPVTISRHLVPTHWNNKPPPYLIVSGFVFSALSVPYLEAVRAWSTYVCDNVSYLLGVTSSEPLEQRNDQVVILTQVLANRANLGYENLTDLHLVTFNSIKVRSLSHLEFLIKNNEDPFMRFEFAPHGLIVVIEATTWENVTDEICKEHFIQSRKQLPSGSSNLEEDQEDSPDEDEEEVSQDDDEHDDDC